MLIKFIILLCLLNVGCVFSQQDNAFCEQIIVPDPNTQEPFPGENIYSIYSAEIEINRPAKKETVQIREFYDGRDNIGVAIEAYDQFIIKTISKFQTNDLLLIKGYDCLVQNLAEAIQNGGAEPFYSIKKNGTDHIVTLLGLFNEKSLIMTYTGEKLIRGIPAKQWGTCTYDQNKQVTNAFLVSFSDPNKWAPAHISSTVKSVPLEIRVASKNKLTGQITNVENFITRYNPEPKLDEDLVYPGPGVYCANRPIATQKPFPNVTSRFPYFSSWIQNTAPASAVNYAQGALRSYRVEHDFQKNLYRLDFYLNNRKITQVHDYNTGLLYTIDVFGQTCEIKPIDSKDEFDEPQVVQQFFQSDKTPAFQYAGATRTRGINTDVWIAPRQYQGQDTIWEWHFMTDQWVSQEINGVRDNEPVLLNIFFPVNNTYKYLDQFHYTQFEATRIDLFDFDLSTCEKNLGSKHIAFALETDSVDDYHLMKANQEIFKDVLMVTIQDKANISLTRIGRLSAYFHNKRMSISMTLLERPSQYGPAVRPPVENNLEGAYEALKKSVISNNFQIMLVLGNAKFVTAVPVKDSWIDLDKNTGRYIFVPYSTNEFFGLTPGTVAGLAIGFLIMGLLGGFGAGYFILIKRGIDLKLPGFLNPNFKADPSTA